LSRAYFEDELPLRCLTGCRTTGRRAALWLSIAVVAFSAAAQSQGGWLERWRSNNDRGNRYEGRIDVPVSGSSIELLSFVGRVERYDDAVDLNVRFYLPTDEQLTCGMSPPGTDGVKVEARELREEKLYYMESKGQQDWESGAWNRFGPWDTRAVLDREGISPSNLGVLVKLDKKPWTAVAPAFVFHTQPPTRVESYRLHLRPNATLSQVSYKLLGCESGERVEVAAATLRGDKIAGEPFAIRLDVSDLSAGPLIVRVNGQVKNRDKRPSIDVRLYHQPEIADGP